MLTCPANRHGCGHAAQCCEDDKQEEPDNERPKERRDRPSRAVAIVMLASAMTSDSGSVSASESELNDLSAKRFVSISITTVAGDNTVTNAEASAGFTVAGVTDETGETVTCSYGGVTDAVTADASTGAFSCLFDDDGTGTYADMSGVSDGTVTVFATVSATNSGNVFATQDTTKPTMTIASAAINSGDTTNTGQ